jgi:hypothetical protein
MKTFGGEWRYSSTILDLGARWRWVVSFMPPATLPVGNSPWYPLYRRLGGPHSQYRCYGEEKYLLLLLGLKPQLLIHRAHSLVTIRTELSQLHHDVGSSFVLSLLYCSSSLIYCFSFEKNKFRNVHIVWQFWCIHFHHEMLRLTEKVYWEWNVCFSFFCIFCWKHFLHR